MNFAATLILILYIGLTTVIAFYYGKRKTASNDDFTVGGRTLGTPILFFTMLATVVGAGSVIGFTGWYYKRGFSQLWFVAGVALCYLLYIYFLAPRINDFGSKHGGETVGDWIDHRYNRVSRILSSVIILIGYLAITAFQYMAMATIFNQVTGLSYNVSLVITAVIVIAYTSFGGFWAVATTDIIQGAMTLLGLLILIPLLVVKAGGLGTVFASAPVEHFQAFGYVSPIAAISYTLVFLLGIVSWPDVWQRCYAAKDKIALKKSLVLFLIAFVVIGAGLALLSGFTALSLYPNHATPEQILPFMVMDQFNVVVGALFLSVLLAVIMGTADSVLLVSAIILHKDLYNLVRPQATDKENLFASKMSTLICGVLVMILAVIAPSMFSMWVMSADLMGATLAVPILLGFAWKKPNSSACVAAIIFGFIGWFLSYTGVINAHAIILGAVFSLAAYLVATFVNPKTEELSNSSQNEIAN